MAEILTPTTRLEAVNTILSSVGSDPVTSLDAPTRSDALNAERSLNDAARMIQLKGWYFNTEKEVPITPDGDGFMNLATNIVKARISDIARNSVTADYVKRGNRMYNRKDRTYVFPAASRIYVDQTLLVAFDETTEAFRAAALHRAGVFFQARYLSSDVLYQFTERLALMAFSMLLEDETEQERFNLQNSGLLRELRRR